MDTQKIFEILEIAETKNDELIKAAYRNKLISVNPEDNPEGFKRLREAYEAALKYAAETNVKIEKKADDPVSLYIERLDEIYRSLSRRLDVSEWEALLKDGLLDDLELGEAAKWGLFRYLVEHYRLPAHIWRLLVRTFHIEDEEDNFKENLPENFVDFMLESCSEESERSAFSLNLLSGKDTADYDEFLQQLRVLLTLMDNSQLINDRSQWLNQVRQKLAYLDTLNISYPYLDLAKAKYALEEGREEESLSIARTLLSSGSENLLPYLLLGCANILNHCGQTDEAEKLYRTLLEENTQSQKEPAEAFHRGSERDIYNAALELAGILLQREDYVQAREYALRANNIYESTEAEQLLFKCNTGVIEQFTAPQAIAEEMSLEDSKQLAWCYIQTNRAQEGVAYFEAHSLLNDDTVDSHLTRATLLFTGDRCEEALAETHKCRICLEKESEVEPLTLSKCFNIEAGIYARLYDLQPDKHTSLALSYQSSALTAYDESIHLLPRELNAWMSKLMFLRKIWEAEPLEEHYVQAVDICNKMKEIEPHFYWTYHYAQEAYEKLGDSRKVIENFFNARQIYVGTAELFERAARVFQEEEQFGNMGHILKLAEESGVESFCLKAMKLDFLRETAESAAQALEAHAFGKNIIAQMEAQQENQLPQSQEDNRLKDHLAEAYRQLALLHDDFEETDGFNDLEAIESWAKRSLELADTYDIHYFLGYFYLYRKHNYAEAYKHLKICEARKTNIHWIYFRIARCYEHWQQGDDAIEYFKKGMEIAPEEEAADYPWRIAWIYRTRFRRTGQPEYYREAIKFLQLMEQFDEDAQNYGQIWWQYADLHARNREYEKALADIERALAKDTSPKYLILKADLLNLMKRSQEAVNVYKQAIDLSPEEDYDYSYIFSQIYEIWGPKKAYKEGLEWFQTCLSPDMMVELRKQLEDYIRFFYIKLEDWQHALDMLKQKHGTIELTEYGYDSWEQEGERIADILDDYQHWLPAEDLRVLTEEAVTLLESPKGQALLMSYYGKRRAYTVIAYIYSNHMLDYETSLHYYQKAWELEKLQAELDGDDADDDSFRYLTESVMDCLWHLGRSQEAMPYRILYLENVAKDYAECAKLGKSLERLFEEDCNRKKHNLHRLFKLDLFCGEYDRAEERLKQLESTCMCWDCAAGDCSDVWECRGYLALVRGRKEEAVACFERANACTWPQNANALMELKRLRLS